jgi:flavin reductase (DIM6/NTAB) family NADH-FMN oxidoreductase RutF
LENNGYFTASFYPDGCRQALNIMGSRSGRDCDKDAEAGLTAVSCGETVTYMEARRTLLCRKLFAQDMKTENFTPEVIRKFYGTEPAHKLYIGEIIEIL